MKKKGLIISTAVMVVVLIAALTTSTFAWFSQNDSVTVSDVQISTKAAEGLQIAFVVDSNWNDGSHLDTALMYGNELVYEAGKWSGGTEGWGGAVGLASTQTAGFTNMEHAITKATVENASGAGAEVGDFIVPTGYDSSIKPTGYTKAEMNKNYLTLPIVLRATNATVAQIYYTITITPNMGDVASVPASLYPGMAAAARMELTINSGKENKVIDTNLTEPFNDAEIKGNTMVVKGSANQYGTAHTTVSRQTSWIYSGLIYGDTEGSKDAIDALQEIEFFLTIWIEGTDSECINVTAGSGFTVDIKFGYKNADDTLLTSDQIGVDKAIA